MYLDQAPLPAVVALRGQTPLTPYRRRITIRRQADGGPLRLPPSSATRWSSSNWPPADTPGPGVSNDAYDMTSGCRVSGTERRRAAKNAVQFVCWMRCADLASLMAWPDVRRAGHHGRARRASGQRRREAPP